MHINELLEFIEKQFPAQTAMEKDKIGLQVHSGRQAVKNIHFTLELNEEVIQEAITNETDCIITFHPLIFYPLISINPDERVGRLCSKLIKHDISLISLHTNFDAFPEGTSKLLCDKLGLKKSGFLKPDPNVDDRGMGVISFPETKILYDVLLEKVSNFCNSPLRYNRPYREYVEKIAIVGGSGGSFIGDALNAGVDAFITADISYHTFHAVAGKMMIIEPGHYEMEQFVPLAMKNYFAEKIGGSIEHLTISKALTNPVCYYPDDDKYKNLQKNYLISN